MTRRPIDDDGPTDWEEDTMPTIDDELGAFLDAELDAYFPPEPAIDFAKFFASIDERVTSETTDRRHEGWPSLRDAVARAIAENRELAIATADELLTLAKSLRLTTPADVITDGHPTLRVLRAERELQTELTRELEELAHGQLDGTDSFNIVLFGRTGTGKSSLLEALKHGDGEEISPGDSDWTIAVNPVDWAHCRLVDTPGIEGWGRTMSRGDLEEQARRELVTADIVILCFDSQNQKAGEFRKVATWIAEYRKPAIAVLNVRQPNWRFPPRVPRRAVRLRSSQTVADHAAHIHEGLTAIGLTDTPILALSAQRAVFARARRPFLVPDDQLESLLAQRDATWCRRPAGVVEPAAARTAAGDGGRGRGGAAAPRRCAEPDHSDAAPDAREAATGHTGPRPRPSPSRPRRASNACSTCSVPPRPTSTSSLRTTPAERRCRRSTTGCRSWRGPAAAASPPRPPGPCTGTARTSSTACWRRCAPKPVNAPRPSSTGRWPTAGWSTATSS